MNFSKEQLLKVLENIEEPDYDIVLKVFLDYNKYRWHDLRKNPDDLPLLGEEIEVFTTDNDYRIVKFTHHSYKYIVAWRYREPFEGGE